MAKAISEEWRELSGCFPSIAKRCGDAVYAIPERLVTAIHEVVPTLFTSEDLAFEMHLARTGMTGFFLTQPFSYWILSSHNSDARSQSDRSIDEEIRSLLVDEAAAAGRRESTVDDYLRAVDQREKSNRLRQAGYVGWLISEATYRSEMNAYNSKWKSSVARRGRFPTVRKSFLGEQTKIDKRSRRFWTDTIMLCRRWGLETCVTWELPVPLSPGLETKDFYVRPDIDEAGLHIFVPNYLLRDRNLSVYEIAELQNGPADIAHLDGWLEDRLAHWGYERYAQMLDLYVYLELAIRRRYGERLKGQTGRLDEAFTRFWHESKDDLEVQARKESTAKTRQELQRRLKAYGMQP